MRRAAHHSSTFAYSFAFLPKAKREALAAVYTFCRASDDIVDAGSGSAAERTARLEAWGAEIDRAIATDPKATDPVALALGDAVRTYGIAPQHVHELVRGVAMDLKRSRYATFEELREYCYHVASSVGLMALPIFGAASDRAKAYAVELGIALQLTNIIRDVGADARIGRIYLPQEDLLRFGCADAELLEARPSDAFLRLMRFQADRAREYFQRARRTFPHQERRALIAASIMERSYLHTLERIERSGFAVFDGPIHASRLRLAMIAASTWLREGGLR